MRVELGLLLVLTVSVTGCVSQHELLVQTLEDSRPSVFRGEVLDLREQAFADDASLREAIAKADVIYVGEFHDNPDQHAFELRVVQLAYEVDPNLAVGFEMFFQPYQAELDLYVAHEIDEVEMLRRTEFFTRWGWGWAWYGPVCRFARDHGLPLVALNVPKEITREVSRHGLDGLTEEQRAELPELDLGNERHRAAFFEALGGSGHGSPEALERFYVAQTIWDEGMADALVRFRRGVGVGRKVVVLAGSRHVESRLGVPSRVTRREPGVRDLVFVPMVVTDGAAPNWSEVVASDAGDFVFLSGGGVGLSGTIGIQLDREAMPDERGFEVKGVVEGSPAEKAKIEAGDRIRAVDGKPVVDYTTLALAAGELTPGRTLVIRLARGEDDLETEVTVAERASPFGAPRSEPKPK